MEEYSVRAHKESNCELPQFRDLVGQLCEKAPEAARTFAAAVLEYHPGDGTQQEPAEHEQEQETAANDGKAVRRKSKSNKDPPYRPPKTTRTQNPNTDETPERGGTSMKDTGDTVETNSGVGSSGNAASLPSDGRHGAQDNLVAETEDAPVDRVVTESVETTEATSAPNMTKGQQTTVPQPASETVLSAP